MDGGGKRKRDDLAPCDMHCLGTAMYDMNCGSCQLRCRGKGGCGEMLPLTEFKQQYRAPTLVATLGPSLFKTRLHALPCQKQAGSRSVAASWQVFF